MLHRINDVCDSEAIAWQLLARIAVSVTRDKGKELGFAGSKQDTAKTDDELAARLTELDYALIFHGNVGDEIKGIERNLPGKNFSESLVMFLRLLGLPLGLPLEIILLDWTKSNYSQSRAVLEQAFTSFIGRQYKIADFGMTPVYEWWLEEDIKNNEYKKFKLDASLIYDHDWIKPSFPWLDQLKEALAWCEKLDRGLATHQLACKSLNSDRDDINLAREAEIRGAIEIVKKIKTDTGIDVPWQHFCGLEVPGGSKSVVINEPPDQNKNKKDDKDADE
jgi:capsid protein